MSDRGDIDIDFADRNKALDELIHIPASIIRNGKMEKHKTGVYFHAVPVDPLIGTCSVDYEVAEDRGFFKIDLLNVSVYDLVRDESHLLEMMHRELDWKIFEDPIFVSRLFHLGNYGDLCSKLKPRCIDHIAMILAMIRPGKKHLQDICWRNGFDYIRDEIWKKSGDDTYYFKHAHGISYAMLVYVHANLLLEKDRSDATMEP